MSENHHNSNVRICDHPLIKHKVTLLRSKNIPPNQFRTLMREISYVSTFFFLILFINTFLFSLSLSLSLCTIIYTPADQALPGGEAQR